LSFPAGGDKPPEVFRTPTLRIGTSETCDVVVNAERYPMVQRIHTELIAGERSAWVYDNNSRSGTWLDGVRVEKARIPPGGTIVIGEGGLQIKVRLLMEGPKTRIIRREQEGAGVATVMRLMGPTAAIQKVVEEKSRGFRKRVSAVLGFFLLVGCAIGWRVYTESKRLGATQQVLRNTELELARERQVWTGKMDQQRQGMKQLQASGQQAEQAMKKQLLDELSGMDAKNQQKQLELRSRLLELRRKHESQLEQIKALKQALGQVARRVEDPFARITQRYSEAIFIIGIRGVQGQLLALGTGFAVRADGVLATNGHVVRSLLGLVKKYRKQGSMVHPVAVMNRRPDRIYRIIDTLTHPGYQPGVTRSKDVTLLLLDMRSARLPAVLPVATTSQLRKLRLGQSIALIGFPGEVNDPYSPIATFKRGDIGRLTTLAQSHGAFEEMILVQHSAPTTPGNSGSPIIDREGRVVAIHNSGLSIRLSRVRFVPSTGLHWGIRADVILELLKKF